MNISEVEKEIQSISNDKEFIKCYNQWKEIDGQCQRWKGFGGLEDDEAAIMFAKLRFAENIRNHYSDRIAKRAFDVAHNSGIIESYDGDTLKGAHVVAKTEDGSPEWHRARRFGLGGSSVRPVLGLHWQSRVGNPVFMSDEEVEKEWVKLAVQKSCDLKRDEIIRATPTSGPAYRGHLWEPALLVYYAAATGKRVAVTKNTWSGDNSFQRVNLDGLILNQKTGEVEGILECKTALRKWAWSDGVPVGYRTQVLWYLSVFDLPYADVVVRYEDGDMDIFRINADETICGSPDTMPISHYMDNISRQWDILKERTYNPISLWSLDDNLINDAKSVEYAGLELLEKPKNNIYRDILNSEINRLDVSSPWQWMPDRFKKVIGQELYSNGEVRSYINSDVDCMVYPVDRVVSFKGSRSLNGIIESVKNREKIYVTDTTTRSFILENFDVDRSVDVINISALRRSIENRANAPDFADMEQSIKWLRDQDKNFKE